MSTGQIANPQGAPKLSEIFTDAQLALIGSSTGDTGMMVLQLLHTVMNDLLRRQNFVLTSSNELSWTSPTLSFNDGIGASNVTLKILQTESASLRTVDLVMTGTMAAPTVANFKDITLNNGEMLYLEIDRSLLLASGGTLNIDNGIDFPSTATVGRRLIKVSLTSGTGMPQLISAETGSATTYYIPLVMRYDPPGGIGLNDIWWIPHGIRWINGTQSILGAIITKGLGTLPDQIVSTQADLVSAISTYSTNGGIICIDGSFNITQNISIPSNVWIIGKGRGRTVLSMGVGYTIAMSTRSKLENLTVSGPAGGTSGSLITMSGNNAKVTECKVILTNTSGSMDGIKVTGNNNKINETEFVGQDDLTYGIYRNGINYFSGTGNVDIDSIWS